MTINVGDRVRDPISGLTGIATGRAVYLWGCVHILVNPGVVKDGTIVDGSWLDEDRLEVVVRGAVRAVAAADGTILLKTGGPALGPLPPSR